MGRGLVTVWCSFLLHQKPIESFQGDRKGRPYYTRSLLPLCLVWTQSGGTVWHTSVKGELSRAASLLPDRLARKLRIKCIIDEPPLFQRNLVVRAD